MKNTVLIFLLLLAGTVKAQTDFWVTFTPNTFGGNIELNLTSKTDATGTITCTGTALNQPFSILADSIVTVSIPNNHIVTNNQTVEDLGIHILSDFDISVFAANYQIGNSDATRVISTPFLGPDYFITTYYWNAIYPSSFIIAGTQDNTTVTIVPSDTTLSGSLPGVPINININEGETYMVRAEGDMSGSTVSSSLPVAVFASVECVNIPAYIAFCDMLFEQMLPTNYWGTEYITGHLEGRKGGDFFRIMANSNNTNLLINGNSVGNLSAGEFIDTTLTNGNWIIADNPISVAQYSRGRGADTILTADPFMIILRPVNQFGNNYNYATSVAGLTDTTYTTIYTKTANTGIVELNGTPVATTWNQCDNSGWSYGSVQITKGAHELYSDSLIGATVYGWGIAGTSTSYGYSAGDGLSIPLGVSSHTIATDFLIFPNPTEGQFTISSRQGAIKKVEVYDLFGRKVLESKEAEIDMRGYARGVFFVRVGEVVRKLVLQ